jgi:FKBP-type peptidyl-prolyl cis-trans isomerase FklB
MTIKRILLFTALVAVIITSCSKTSVKSAKVKTSADSLSYAFGINFFHSAAADNIEIDPLLMAKGMIDAKNEKAGMDETAARGFIMMYIQKKQQQEMMAMYQGNKEEGEKFLETNKKREGVTTTESGLQYEVITMGTGVKPTAESVVRVHYTGMLTNGTTFDSSVERDEPAEFAVGGVIPGWVEALQLMPVGSKFKIYIPYTLGYGEGGAGEVIPPYSALIFEVELLDIIQ